jgi:hypothetical protein
MIPYKDIRELFFQYFKMEKEMLKLDNKIQHFENRIPYDNGVASDYVMSLIDGVEKEKIELKKTMDDVLEEIKILLK